jgi:hypothetical protein
MNDQTSDRAESNKVIGKRAGADYVLMERGVEDAWLLSSMAVPVEEVA